MHSCGVRTVVRQMMRQKPNTVSKVNLKSRDIENSPPHENQESLGTRAKAVLVGTAALLWDLGIFTKAFSKGCINEGRQQWHVEACLLQEQMGDRLSMTYCA